MAALGFKPEDYSAEFAVWPENDRSVRMFFDIGTQWRTGPGGAIGLDYNVLLALCDRRGIVGDEFEQMLLDIGVLESAAMATMKTAVSGS